MDPHDVWLALPSANPEAARRTLPAWRAQGYRVAMLQDRVRFDAPEADRVLRVEAYPGWAGSINLLCAQAVPRTASIVVAAGDDMLPDPAHQAPEIACQFLAHFPDAMGVMQPQGDTYLRARDYCGSPWLGRGWIDRAYQGQGPMPPGYRHGWADLELYWVARGLGRLWERPDLTQRHEHFWRDGGTRPPHRARTADPSDRQDVQRYLARRWLSFPGCEPLGDGPRFDPAVLELDTQRLAERHWSDLYGFGGVESRGFSAFRRALTWCAAAGKRRVAIYGAGTHTRTLGPALMDPEPPVVCIVDDDPAQSGSRLWNIPVVPATGAMALGVDAVILSSNSMEDRLWERAEGFRRAGVPVLRLYGPGASLWRPEDARAGAEAPAPAAPAA